MTTTSPRAAGPFRLFASTLLAVSAALTAAPPALANETCVFTRGYWATHGAAWPVDTLVLGSASNPNHRYSRSELLGLLAEEARGDASLILAAQLIAAKLNVANGSNAAPIADTLGRADTLLGVVAGRLPHRVRTNTAHGADMVDAATVLEWYNSGQIAGSCRTANRPPVADAGPDQSAAVGGRVTLDGSGSSDPDGDPLTFRWAFVKKPADSQADLSDLTAVLPTFVLDVPGTYELQLVVNDGRTDSSPDTVVVSNVSAPAADAGPDQTTPIAQLVQLDGSRSTDPDGDQLTFAWTILSAPAGSAAVLSNPSAVNPTFVADLHGDYVIQLVVSDGALESEPDTVAVSTVNSPPVANAGSDQTAFVGDTVTLSASGSSDVDGDALVFRWSLSSKPDGSAAALSDPAAISPSLVIDRAGMYVVQLVVNDGVVDSDPDTVTITTQNSRPVANAGPDQSVFVGATVELDGSASTDVDGNDLTYRWSFTNVPAGSAAALSDAAAVRPSFVVDKPGDYIAQLIVNDGAVDSVADTVTISTVNRPPTANAGPDQTVQSGATVALDGSASSDPDGDALTFRWALTTVPVGSTAVLSDPGAATPSFVADRPGQYVAQLIVNDGAADSAPDTVAISTDNSVPTAQAGPDQTVATGTPVQLDGSASSDPDGTALQYFWSLTSRPAGSSAALSNASIASPTFVADKDGLYVAQLIVGDGVHTSEPDTVAVTAQAGADLRTRFILVPVSPAVGSSVTLHAEVLNDGPAGAEDVTARFEIPAGYSYVSHGFASNFTGGTFTYDPATGVWTISTLPAGRLARVSVSARVNPSGPYDLLAEVTDSTAPDPNLANNTATAAITPNPNADLRISFFNPPSGTLTVGTNVSWMVELRNAGPATTANVIVQHVVPPGYTVTSTAVHFVGPYDLATGTWNVGPMSTSGLGRLFINARVNAAGSTGLLATVSHSDQPDPDLASNTAVAAPINRPPVANAGSDHATSTHTTVALDGAQSSDAENDPITYLWEFALRPVNSAATLANAATAAPSFVPDQGGNYVVRLTVTDPSGATGTDTVAVTAAVLNRHPVIRSTPNTLAAVGQPYRYDVQADDPDAGQTLAFALPSAPAGMTIDSASGVIDWTPASGQGGPQNVVVQVSDAGGLSATQAFTVQVSSEANHAPIAEDDAFEVRVNESLGIAAPGVLQNDQDESSLRGRVLTPPANGTLIFNEDGSFVYTPHTQQPGELVLAENVNLAARLPGVQVNVSGFSFHGQPCGRPECGIDENPATSWSTHFQAQPFFEVQFAEDVVATEVQILGHRNPFLMNFKVTAGIFQVFAADGSELFTSGNVELPGPARDARVMLGRLERVRRVRFSPTAGDGGTVFQRGFAEMKVIGSGLLRREVVHDPNVARLLPATVQASSVTLPNLAEGLIDETSANWYAATANAGEFVEIRLPRDVTVTGLESANPSARPDGFGTSLGINCFGSFTLLAADGQVLFDSGVVNTPFGGLSASITFALDTGTVAGVRRVRYTTTGCSGFPLGFSEIRVFGTADVETPAFSMRKKFQALTGREVHSTPIVINLTDDNSDGVIDEHDIPDIVVPVEGLTTQLRGEIKAISGDDGRELFTAGSPDLVSPWSELAAADLDGDGRPEIVAVHGDRNHLIAFDHTGATKWISDAHAMPQFNLSGSIVGVGAVTIANLDGAGRPEIVIGASVFDADGRLLSDGRTLGGTTGGTGLRSAIPAVADIDLDGVPELVAGPTAYRLVNGSLTKAWQRTDRGDGFVAIANFDDDPQAEIVVVANGSVYMLNHDGSDGEVWNPSTHAPVPLPGGGQAGAPLVVDVDGDGRPEIGVAGDVNYVLFNRDGSIRWRTVVRDRSSQSTGSIAFDLDGDGQVEIIYRDEFFLRVYRGTDGVLLAKTPVGSATWAEEPVVADVDRDGHADLVVSSDFLAQSAGQTDTGVIVLQDVANKWARTRGIWNQHAYHVTNVNDDGSIPLVETPHWLVPGLNSFRTNAFPAAGNTDRADRFTYVASDGTLESNVATVHIAVRTPNAPPQITSSAITSAAREVGYRYAVIAHDPDSSDLLTFSLPTAPAGMTIDPITGLVRWVPADAQAGTHDVIVKVEDLRGLYAVQGFSVTVADPVAVPDLIGQPQSAASSAIASAGLVLGAVSTRHSPTVPEGSVLGQTPTAGTLVAPQSAVNLVVSLGPAPAGTVPDVVGMTQVAAETDIAAAGFVLGAVAGQHHATVPANTVLAQNPPAGTNATIGSAVGLLVSLGQPPGEIDLDGDGFSGNQGDCNDGDPAIHPGAVDIPGDGIDQNCNGVDSVVGDETPPSASLESPADLAVVTMPTDIIGSVSDANFLRYTLSLAEVDADTSVTIGSGTAAVSAGVLGRIDPTLLENGLYRVRLVAEDVNGQTAVDERVYRVDGMAKVGNFRLAFTDLSVPVAGIPITVTRTYDSRVKTKEDFGIGWTLDISRGRYRHNRTPGRGWIIEDQPFLGQFLPCIGGTRETLSHATEVRLSDRESYIFALRITNGNLGVTGACEGVASFELVNGTRPGATLEILDGTGVIYLRGGDDTVLDMNAFLEGTERPYDPQRVRLTTLDGTRIELDRRSGITRIVDLNGNHLQITRQGIVHSAGKTVSFLRDDQDRIVRITDPRGNSLTYGYDDRGDLTAFTDLAGARTTFVYDDDHNLTEIRDALGRRALNEYDADGRLIAVIDPAGHRTAIAHDLAAGLETITDRLGHTTVIAYDERGNVVRRVDALGQTTAFTYDARDNMLSETDALGHVHTYAYDANDNRVSHTDPLGQITTWTYDSRGQVLTMTDPRGGVTTRTYDANGNLSSLEDAAGGRTTNAYDSRGSLIRKTDPVGATWTHTYDSAGQVTRTINPLGDTVENTRDASGNVLIETRQQAVTGGTQIARTQYTYDALGRRTRIINAGGAVHEAAYTATGQVASRVEPCCGTTTFTYDEQDRLIRTVFADGTSESIGYDAEDRTVEQTDRANRTTRFSYDALGRLLTTTFADGATRSAVYDAIGRKTADVDELGATTRYTYDAMGRLTSTRDPLNAITTAAYDESGNITSTTDRNGRTTTYLYDPENRRIRSTFADGTSVSETYDGAGRVISRTDQDGHLTQFEYDARGALTRVVDALGHSTRHAFSQFGRRVSQIDPLGNTTRFDYDILGRLTQTTRPMGQTEVRTYDVAGRLISLRDYNGRLTSYTYDAMNRLSRRTLPDGEEHRFVYTPTGQIAGFTDPNGTTTIGYDDRDRPTVVRRPDGAEIRYSYDAAGNRTAVATAGGTVSYGYDANHRVTELADFDDHRSRFEYDAEGNLTSIGYANGIVARYQYDQLNRLTDVTHALGSSTVRSFRYTLGATGNRTRVEEDSGRIVEYTYDKLFRLLKETITEPGAEAVVLEHTYDAAGNRLSRTGPAGSVSYTYDANSRLVQAGPSTFAYDANGNLLSKQEGGVLTGYEYDGLNRLVRSTSSAGVTQYVYDAMGHRVLKSDVGGTTRFLVDPFGAGDLSQVLRETAPAGTVDYVRARGMLLSMRGPLGTSYHLHDARLSTRMLADASGAITDRYDYDAFGNVLRRDGVTPNPYLFDGQEFDPSLRFYNLRARYYDPNVGRFTATDPFPGLVFEPLSLHPYTYAYNDPVNRSDPSGKFTLGEQMMVVSIVGVTASLAYGGQNYYYYRSADLAFEVAVDAFITHASLALDVMGAGAIIRSFASSVVAGITAGAAGRTFQKTLQTGTSFGKRLRDVVDNALCRFNNPRRCGLTVQTAEEAKAAIERAAAESGRLTPQQIESMIVQTRSEAEAAFRKRMAENVKKFGLETIQDAATASAEAIKAAARKIASAWWHTTKGPKP